MSDIIEIEGQHYIRASASIADASTRVLKHADTFVIFDRHGDIRPLGFENQGVFHEGTRFLSRWKLKINGVSPLLLNSNVKEDNDFLIVDLTNPVLPLADGSVIPHGTIHLVRTIFIWDGSLFERTSISNFALRPVSLQIELEFEADYVDLFEIRGSKRNQRGKLREPAVALPDEIVLAYDGLDSTLRQTRLHFNSSPAELYNARAVFRIELDPRGQKNINAEISFEVGNRAIPKANFDAAFEKVHAAFENYRKNITQVETSNAQFNNWINQSRADLHLLLTQTSEGLYPYAGIPWFSCIFGRDGIITALETLWMFPEMARGVLSYLATRQASETNPIKDAEPGKILHEERKGEMVALGEVPFGSYYGSIDSTPLWLILAGKYFERTGDKEFIAQLWHNIERALSWIDTHGDCDGDGFVEYCRHASGGLSNQGWKDAEDSVFHADGKLPAAPIALCEVQGYVYEAKQCAAQIAEALGRHEQAESMRQSAQCLKAQFHQSFWCEEIQSYAIALDGDKKPCCVRSSNAGQCLFSGIAREDSAAKIKNGLLDSIFSSGWGIRTIPTSEIRYNPMSYHNGSIWPHDNALITFGLARYGFKDAALKVLSALFDASKFMELHRLPELFCGFRRRNGEGPTLYPVACNPQAWSSAAVFFLLQACLGLRVEAMRERLYFDNPHLPESIQQLEIRNLKVGSGSVDVLLVRHEQGVAVNVLRRVGKVEVSVRH
jgi:glycogen debranching enzyme